MTTSARYAVYLVPPRESRLWKLGCEWLGRDPESGEVFAPPEVEGCAPEKQQRLIRSARMYGFHATMKPPFQLAEGVDEGRLADEVARLAASIRSYSMPALKMDRLGGFVALVPAEPNEALADLASRCVTELDAMRAPMDDEERERRLTTRLSDRQRELMERWGYPYVLEEFRFHMTLTDRLDENDAALLVPWIGEYFAEVLQSGALLAELAIFMQPGAGKDFVLRRRTTFGH
ncbi:MAG TPA: DUF1045 domain-containing protein [Burkholderiales bacterium]|nr:DUF1045 domain-containing protein [Burkholderiales bacterium]